MAGVLYDADNVIVGNAVLMITPWTLVPAVIPPDSTPLFTPADTAWTLWNSAGATNEGFKVNIEVSTTQITIEEQSTAVGNTVESKNIGIEAELAEDTVKTVQLAWGGGTITTTAASSGIPGTDKMSLVDDIVFWTVCLETRNKQGRARRLYIPKTTIIGSGETSFRRAADKRMYPIAVTSVCKPSDIKLVDITAAALP